MDPGTTTILGKYAIGPLLGQGSFAKVYKCETLTTKTDVAIKITTKSKATNTALAPYLLREVTVMRRLNHPNILRIHELLATKSNIYLVIDLARGGDLQTLLYRRNRLPVDQALRIFHQLVSALDFCHQHGVTHRDLKPHNILLDEFGHVKLSDFGLSAVAGEGTAASTELLLHSQCGTVVFMAPEVMAKSAYDGAKADSWSCGVILYVMVVGDLPFDYKDVLRVMYNKMIRHQFSFPPWLSKPVRALIYRLLDPDPDTRLSVGDIARDAWFKSGGFGPKRKPLGDLVGMSEGGFGRGSYSVTAFDLIGSSFWMDLSGMFDDVVERKRRVFTVNEAVEVVVERVVVVGGRLGYEVKSGEGWKIWMRKERLVLVVEVFEVVSELSLVDVEVVEGCRCNPCRGDGGIDEIGGMQDDLFKFLFYGSSH